MTLVQYFIISHLGYYSSLPTSFPDSRIGPLTHPFPTVARVISLKRASDHITPLLEILQQLPMPGE